jgi:hypothetical protein
LNTRAAAVALGQAGDLRTYHTVFFGQEAVFFPDGHPCAVDALAAQFAAFQPVVPAPTRSVPFVAPVAAVGAGVSVDERVGATVPPAATPGPRGSPYGQRLPTEYILSWPLTRHSLVPHGPASGTQKFAGTAAHRATRPFSLTNSFTGSVTFANTNAVVGSSGLTRSAVLAVTERPFVEGHDTFSFSVQTVVESRTVSHSVEYTVDASGRAITVVHTVVVIVDIPIYTQLRSVVSQRFEVVDNPREESGLDSGTIIGIVSGSAVVLAGLLAGVVYVIRVRRERSDRSEGLTPIGGKRRGPKTLTNLDYSGSSSGHADTSLVVTSTPLSTIGESGLGIDTLPSTDLWL